MLRSTEMTSSSRADDSPAGGSPATRFASATAVMAVVCAAQFVLQLDFSIVNVALAAIQIDLHMVPAELQWIVTGYALTFGALLLAGGRLADLLGRRRLLALGVVGFGLTSLACGLAQSSMVLIVGRVVQGSFGAMLSPAALSLLTTTNAEGPARNRALAIWQATTAAGATTGIIAGGLLTQYLGWRAVFLVNLPVVAVMLAFLGRLPAGRPTSGQRLDTAGALLVTGAIAALISGLSNGQQHGFAAPTTIAALAAALVLGAAFVATERVVAAPMLPKALLAAPSRRAAIAAMLLIGAVLAGYVYFLSLYLQGVLRFSPVATGLALVPSTLTVVLTSTLGARRLVARAGIKPVLLAGLASMAAGQLLLAQISARSGYAASVLSGQLATAVGIGLALPSSSIAITSGVRGSDQGLAGALFTTSQQTGAAVGLAVLAAAAAARSAQPGGSPVDGYRLSFLIAAGLALLAAVIVGRLLRSTQQQPEPPHPDAAAPPLAEAQLRKC
jgi:EmrB/QacA subfamily drug resistance transporter